MKKKKVVILKGFPMPNPKHQFLDGLEYLWKAKTVKQAIGGLALISDACHDLKRLLKKGKLDLDDLRRR